MESIVGYLCCSSSGIHKWSE